jgi:hypothetical protein
MANNVAFYDAVVAGAGGSIQGWVVDQTPADYALFANAVAAIATTVDLQIPAIPGGPNVSQVNLLMCITQNVLAGRFPQDATLALYVNLGKSIAAIYAQVSPKLLGAVPTGGKTTLAYFVDPLNASATAAARTGTLGSPYISVSEALAAAVTAGLTKVQVIVSGTDAVAIVVPATLTDVCIAGWTSMISITGFYDVVSGAITLSTPAGGTRLQFDRIRVNSAITMTNGNPIIFTNSKVFGLLTGDAGAVTWIDTQQIGNVTYAGGISAQWDDASWTYAKVGGAVIAGAPVTNFFVGIGPRRYVSAIVINGVAIGATSQGATVLAAAVAGMFGIVTPTGVVPADYAIQFKYTDAGNVYWTLTNISRVSTNFNEPVEFLLMNGGLI